MKPLDCDGLINGRESRGLLCRVCHEVIEQGATDTCPDYVDISRARVIAKDAHGGQRYGDEDYFDRHVCDVVARVRNGDRAACRHVVVAYLHDVVEDTSMVLADLDFTDEIKLAVDAITRRPGENYFDYIGRSASNEIASIVKRHDLESNINEATPESLVIRNRRALEILDITEHLASLEFEVRREEGQDRDETAKSIDHYRRKLKRIT